MTTVYIHSVDEGALYQSPGSLVWVCARCGKAFEQPLTFTEWMRTRRKWDEVEILELSLPEYE